jgi:hypothetical protein
VEVATLARTTPISGPVFESVCQPLYHDVRFYIVLHGQYIFIHICQAPKIVTCDTNFWGGSNTGVSQWNTTCFPHYNCCPVEAKESLKIRRQRYVLLFDFLIIIHDASYNFYHPLIAQSIYFYVICVLTLAVVLRNLIFVSDNINLKIFPIQNNHNGQHTNVLNSWITGLGVNCRP